MIIEPSAKHLQRLVYPFPVHNKDSWDKMLHNAE